MRTGRMQLLVVGVVLLVLLVGNVVATHNILTEPHPGHNDFMSRWEGVRSFWRDGLNPYSDEASLNIQQQIYGRAAQEDEDPGYFAYPFYVVLLLGPLAYTSYAWASAIWMVVLEVALIAALFLLLDMVKWRPRPWLLGVLLLWALLNYYAARGLLLGQPGHLVYFFQVLTFWALANRHDRLAGAAMALSTIKPQMVFLIVPLLLVWAWRTRRVTVIASFGVVWGGLMAASFMFEPTWLGDWLDQLQQYPSYTAFGAPVWIVMQHYLGFGDVGEWLVTAVLWSVLVWAWFGVLVRGRSERFDWAVMLALTITHLSAVRTATPHFVVFTIPLVFYFKLLGQRRAYRSWLVVILVLLVVMPWAHFLLTVDGEFEHATVYLPLPIGMFILLIWTRAQWWRSAPLIAASATGGGRSK